MIFIPQNYLRLIRVAFLALTVRSLLRHDSFLWTADIIIFIETATAQSALMTLRGRGMDATSYVIIRVALTALVTLQSMSAALSGTSNGC